MTANELADLLDFDAKTLNWKAFADAATMLRQQADLIRNLQKSLGFKNSGYETINLTPQLELTDEEIVNLYKETEADNGGIREFARAILKKAREK